MKLSVETDLKNNEVQSLLYEVIQMMMSGRDRIVLFCHLMFEVLKRKKLLD
jgi:hypothetical protein